jgi:arginine repressor
MKFSSDSMKVGVSVMMIVTIEVINGRLMTKLVVVNQLLSITFGITLVLRNLNLIGILATICGQEKVLIDKKDAKTWKVVHIIKTLLLL